MIRKMLLIASAIAVPLGATAVSAVAGPSIAGATPLAITCHISGVTINFATPGISQGGSFTSSPTSTSTTTASTLACGSAGSGTSAGNTLVKDNTQCTGTNAPVTGCSVGQYNYDSASAFAGGATTLWTQLPKMKFKINGVTYKSKSTSSSSTFCTGGEPGFTIKGKLTSPAAHANEPAKLTACLGHDTGPGTTGSFAADFNQPGVTIATVDLASDSKAKIQ